MGLVERQNPTIQRCLVKTLKIEQREWKGVLPGVFRLIHCLDVSVLPGVVFEISTSKHYLPGFTAFFMRSRSPRVLVDVIANNDLVYKNVDNIEEGWNVSARKFFLASKKTSNRLRNGKRKQNKTKPCSWTTGPRLISGGSKGWETQRCVEWSLPHYKCEDNGTYSLEGLKRPLEQKAHGCNLKGFVTILVRTCIQLDIYPKNCTKQKTVLWKWPNSGSRKYDSTTYSLHGVIIVVLV